MLPRFERGEQRGFISMKDTEHTKIMRYLDFKRFKKALRDSVMYLPNAYAYENMGDINEGRFSKDYFKVLQRNANLHRDSFSPEMLSEQDADGWIRDEVAAYCGMLRAARAHSFISCWTLSEREKRDMWEDFTTAGDGVLLFSKVGLVYEQLEEGAVDVMDNPHLDDRPITYDREKQHLRLDFRSVDDFLFPLFSLNGDEEQNFKHENEYRFVVHDFDLAGDDLQFYVPAKPGPTEVTPEKEKRRKKAHPKKKVIAVPVNYREMLLEVRTDPRGGDVFRDTVAKALGKYGLANLVKSSELAGK